MKTISSFLIRLLGTTFYRKHAGMFLFLFFLLFGIQPTAQEAIRTHYYLIRLILTSANFFVFTIFIWLIYIVKSILYIKNLLQQDAYQFLFNLNALPPQRRYKRLFSLSLIILAPISFYSILIFGIALKDGYSFQGILIILIIFVLHALKTVCFIFLLKLAGGLREKTISKLPIPYPKTFLGFVLKGIFRKNFATFVIIKLLSFTSLYFFTTIENSLFESRILWLIYLTALTGHSFLIFNNFHFIEKEMRFIRNMPQPRIHTFMSLLVVYVIVLLPEAWCIRALITHQHNPVEYFWMVITGPLFLLLLHSLLYTETMKIADYLKLLFGVWMVFLFFSFSNNHWLMPLICLVFSTVIFFISYYQYEENAAIPGIE